MKATALALALSRLSAPGAEQGLEEPYTHAISENLIVRYEAELKDLSKNAPKGLGREALNAYYTEAMRERNAQSLRLIEAEGGGAKAPAELQGLLEELILHPVARLEVVDKFDQRGDIGFCFGRALLVHDLLISRGYVPEDIAKIFAVGQLKVGDQLWDYHMATMVRQGRSWWIIDSLFSEPLRPAMWVREVQRLDVRQHSPRLRFYVTEARKFQPAYGAYELRQLEIPELKPYFLRLYPEKR